MAANPYRRQPDRAFWARAVARPAPDTVDPVGEVGFDIRRSDRVATVGSCFAQHISRALEARGFDYLVTEDGPAERGYGVYPARFGNLYTARQLLQLFQRAFGLFAPAETAWSTDEGVVDPFRPQVEPGCFADLSSLQADQAVHLEAVRRMFETADVLVFTLGLTEGWVSTIDGAVVPLAPGVVGFDAPSRYAMQNFTVAETVEDLDAFIRMARILRPRLKIILTVSPVALVATMTDRHVLTATTYSKSVLRVAAQTVADTHEGVDYFPSYEIVTGPHNGHRFLASDLRTVLPEGVEQVMGLFARHYLNTGTEETVADPAVMDSIPAEVRERHAALSGVICDEEANDPG